MSEAAAPDTLRLADRAATPPRVSIIVPTLDEAANLPELFRRIDVAMAGEAYEVVVIDDRSTDGTAATCEHWAATYPVRLHVRAAAEGGLSGAVIRGLHLARGEVLVVMDADLQHPPERLPALFGPLLAGEADFTLGSRHVDGGSTAERWGLFRRINSKVATLLARPFAGATRDPMSGFFALRRETFARARHLTPLGYKVGLELMCKCRVRLVREVPIYFGTRAGGASKLTIAQQFKYLEHLSRLYDFCYPRLSPAVKFLVVAACGGFVALAAFGLLLHAGLSPFAAAPLAYPAAALVTAIFHGRYVRAQRAFIAAPRPFLDFCVVSLAEWATCAAAAAWMAGRLRHTSGLEVFLLTLAAAMTARYVLRKELLLDLRGLRRTRELRLTA